MCEVIFLRAGDVADTAVAGSMEAQRRGPEAGKTVAVDIGMGQQAFRAAVGDEGNAARLQKFDALVLPFGADEKHGVDATAIDEAAADVEFALATRHRRNHQIEAGSGKMFGTAGQHIEEMRRTDMARIARQRDGNELGALPAEATGRSIRPVADLVGGLTNPFARGGRHIGITVERTRHRGDRQSERLRELFEISQDLPPEVGKRFSKTFWESSQNVSDVVPTSCL